MAASDVTVTGNLTDALGTTYDYARTKMWLTFNTENGRVTDDEGVIRVDAGTATVNADGSFELAGIPIPGASNPASFQCKIHFDVPPRLPGSRDANRFLGDFGWMTITDDATLAELEEEQAVPAEYLTEVTTALDALREAAEDSADAAAASESAAAASAASAGELTELRVFVGPVDPSGDLAPGTEYVWNKTDGAGALLDILSGVA